MQNLSDFFTGILPGVELWHVALAAVILLVLAIILICALSTRNRKYDELLDEKDAQAIDAQRLREESERALAQKERALESEKAMSEEALREKEKELSALSERVKDLQSFHDEYQAIPDAQTEAGRIIREAKDHAYIVSNQTEMEYAEIIAHANEEAQTLHAAAQERLNRSHEVLKKALARASEIVETAHAEAARIVALEAPREAPLIEAPAQTDTAPEAPTQDAPETPEVPEPKEEMEDQEDVFFGTDDQTEEA